MSILIKKALILTQNTHHQSFCGYLYIEDDRIVELSERPIAIEAEYTIDGRYKVVLPGLINLHTHIPMTLFRGYGDDMLLQEWLEKRIWPLEAKLDKKSITIGTRLGLLEMIASGTTCFLDMYFFEDTIAQTTEQAGMRGFLGFPFIDFGTPEVTANELVSHCEYFLKKWKNHPLITPVIAPHSVYTCNSDLLMKAGLFAETYDSLLHIHCAETREEIYTFQKRFGIRPIEYLKKLGLIDKHVILAHCGWITKNEICDIQRGGASVVHCPVSNMKIATGGYTPVPELLQAHIPLGLGTDGAASNNSLNMFDTMKFCALLHKQHRWDPQVITASTVFDMATIGGAHCLNYERTIGSLEIGKKADIIILDTHKPHLTPNHNFVSNLVYAAEGSDVCTTIVNGKILMLDHTFLTIDFDKTLEEAQACAHKLTS